MMCMYVKIPWSTFLTADQTEHFKPISRCRLLIKEDNSEFCNIGFDFKNLYLIGFYVSVVDSPGVKWVSNMFGSYAGRV